MHECMHVKCKSTVIAMWNNFARIDFTSTIGSGPYEKVGHSTMFTSY
jgi:hypothetical protein